MLGRLALFSIRHRKLVFVITILLTAVALVFGNSVENRVKSQGFDDPHSQAQHTSDALRANFNVGDPNLTLLVEARLGNVDDAPVRDQAVRMVGALGRTPGVSDIQSYWTSPGQTDLKSRNGTSALVLARVNGDENGVAEAMDRFATMFSDSSSPVNVRVGGFTQINYEVDKRINADVPKAEIISLPIVLVLLIFVFGGLIAALTPILIGVLAIVGTLLVLRLLTGVTDVSVYAINITTMLGLGLAIDYSLFIITRYREELHAGVEQDAAIVRAVETGGRTVIFSAVAVAISLAALAVFPLYFLTSLGYAGISVVALAALVSVTFLPALLSVIGPHIDSLRIIRRPPGGGEPVFWGKVARLVMKRPLIVAVVTLALLLFVGSPFLGVNFGRGDDRALPKDSSARQVSEKIRTDFQSNSAFPVSVLAANVSDPRAMTNAVADYAQRLSDLKNVARVDTFTGSYVKGASTGSLTQFADSMKTDHAVLINVIPAVDPQSHSGLDIVRDVRNAPAPFTVGVTGLAAFTVDSDHAIAQRLPYAGAGIALVIFVVLFLLTGSILLPLKTVVLSFVSLTATFGAMVWVFQDGHLASLLNFTPTGVTDSTNPLLMFGIAFGLSMDYAVFLLARIKEEHDKGLDTEQAVVKGLEKSGRVVTAAAVLIAVVFFAFGTSSVVFLKLIGMGLALAILVDATIIRGLLVPSFMRLMGDANWWAPRFLKPVYARFAISEQPVGAIKEESAG